jgi:hypothetical protein
MVADWEVLSKSEVRGSVGIADKQKTKSRNETIKCSPSRNNLPIQGLLLRLFCNFAVGLRQLHPKTYEKKKKRYAYLEVGNVGNSRLFREKKRNGFSRYSVGCYYHTL